MLEFFDLFSEFGTIENALLNFESLKYQSEFLENETFEIENLNLTFYNVSTKDKDTTNLSNINLSLNENTFNLFIGEFNSGKETLYNLLNQIILSSLLDWIYKHH